MFKEISFSLYGVILNAEVLFLRYYKVNPFEIMKDISLLDLQTYIKKIEDEEKKESKKINKKDFITALKQISELLNYMFYKK